MKEEMVDQFDFYKTQLSYYYNYIDYQVKNRFHRRYLAKTPKNKIKIAKDISISYKRIVLHKPHIELFEMCVSMIN